MADMDDFRVDVARHDDHAVVTVAGELDAATAPALHQALVELSAAGIARVVIDLRPLTFVDSYGLGVIVGAKKRLSQRGNALCLVVDDTQNTLRRLLEITGLDKVLPVHATLSEAVDACLDESAA